MDKQNKIKRGMKLQSALKKNKESFVLLECIDELSDKIDNIPQVDLSEIKQKLNDLENEEIEIELIIDEEN
jgi:hypothetical protein